MTPHPLSKAQFLITESDGVTTLQSFRRMRRTALVDPNGKVLRLMDGTEFRKLPAQTRQTHELHQIWTLIPS